MNTFNSRFFAIVGGALLIVALGAVAAYFIVSNSSVAVDAASIEAPLITLTPTVPGHLDAVYVHVGDLIAVNTPVAQVGSQVITSKSAGTIVAVNDTVGALVGAGESVVTMIDPSQLRVVGKIDENKGLTDLKVGDPVTFTVDAFGGKTFTGILDEISPTSNQSGIVFNISSQRQTQQFNIKARFNTSAYPELKNGMSARMWVHIK